MSPYRFLNGCSLVLLVGAMLAACTMVQPSPDMSGPGTQTARAAPLAPQVRALVQQHGVTQLDPGPVPAPAKVKLGQALFFEAWFTGEPLYRYN